MAEGPTETCPGCGIALPAAGVGIHPYLGASASCWAAYGEILAREFSDPEYMKAHRMTVDAYAAQHPGRPERRTIQSIHVHLAGLYLTLEKQLSGSFVRKVIGQVAEAGDLPWLQPPASLGSITILDVFEATNPDEHETLVRQWARSVWKAWEAHHGAVIQRTDAVAALNGSALKNSLPINLDRGEQP